MRHGHHIYISRWTYCSWHSPGNCSGCVSLPLSITHLHHKPTSMEREGGGGGGGLGEYVNINEVTDHQWNFNSPSGVCKFIDSLYHEYSTFHLTNHKYEQLHHWFNDIMVLCSHWSTYQKFSIPYITVEWLAKGVVGQRKWSRALTSDQQLSTFDVPVTSF